MFSAGVIEKAWKKSGGRCVECGKSLIYVNKSKYGQRGSWEAYDKTGLNGNGPDSVSNCSVLCSACYGKHSFFSFKKV